MTPTELRLYDIKKALEACDIISKRLFLADFIAGDDVLEKFKNFESALKSDYKFRLTFADE